MGESIQPTPYADVNAVLGAFLADIRALLGGHFRGMYLYGSLAVGDFDHQNSDIDYLVATVADLPDDLVRGLHDMHARFDASDSPWAGRIEAAYIPLSVLRLDDLIMLPETGFPQIEKGRVLERMPLEDGWVFQRQSLRDFGISLAGPEPRTFVAPAAIEEMRRAALIIVGEWSRQACDDPEWLAWVGVRQYQAFVVVTLCRLLYSLATGTVASKLAAARWGETRLGPAWAPLIARALLALHDESETPTQDLKATIAFIEFTLARCRGKDGPTAEA